MRNERLYPCFCQKSFLYRILVAQNRIFKQAIIVERCLLTIFLSEHEIKFTEIFASRECWFLVKVKCSFNYNNYYIARTHNSSVDYIIHRFVVRYLGTFMH